VLRGARRNRMNWRVVSRLRITSSRDWQRACAGVWVISWPRITSCPAPSAPRWPGVFLDFRRLDLLEALRDLAAGDLHVLGVLVRLADVVGELLHALVEALEIDAELFPAPP